MRYQTFVLSVLVASLAALSALAVDSQANEIEDQHIQIRELNDGGQRLVSVRVYNNLLLSPLTARVIGHGRGEQVTLHARPKSWTGWSPFFHPSLTVIAMGEGRSWTKRVD